MHGYTLRSGLLAALGLAVLILFASFIFSVSFARADDSAPADSTDASSVTAPTDSSTSDTTTDASVTDPTVSNDQTSAPDASGSISSDSSDTQTPPVSDTSTSASAAPAQSPALSTDQADYAPGSIATIFGSFFGALQQIVLHIIGTNPDGSHTQESIQNVTTDANGAFSTAFALLPNYVPLYTVTADDASGNQLAQTTFTDSVQVSSVTVGAQTPNPVVQGSSATYAITVNFSGSGSTCTAVLTAALPAGASGNFANPSLTSPTNSTTLTVNTTGSTPIGTNGFTVTATPGAGCGGGGAKTASPNLVVSSAVVKTDPTLSITNSPVTYNGSPQSATINPSTPGTVSNVKYNGSATVPTAAGSYTVTADFTPTDTTDFNPLTGASAGTFVIQKANPNCSSIAGYSVTYDGNPHTATGSCVGVGSDGTLSGLNLSATTHTAAGTYNGDAWSIPASANYNAANGTVNDAIGKATPSITWENPADITFGTALSATQLDASANTAGTFVYTPVAGTVLNAGSAQTLHVDFTPNDTTDFAGASKDVTINVLKAGQTITVDTSAPATETFGQTFDVAAHSSSGLDVAITATGVCTVQSGGTNSATILMTSGTGTCTVHYNQGGDSSYNAAPEVTSDTTAGKADQAPLVVTDLPASATYLEAGITAGASGGSGTGAVSFDAAASSACSTDPSTGDVSITSGTGTCSITASKDGDDDYNPTTSDPVSITVNKADAIIVVTAYDGTYNGVAHTAEGAATGIETPTPADLSALLDLSGTTHTNAGTYTGDTWTFAGNDDYNSDSGTVDDSLAKADASCTVNAYTTTYDGNAHTATGHCDGVNGETNLTTLDLSGTTHTAANPSGYSDTWNFTSTSGNYNDASGQVTDIINKANQAITFGSLADQIFGATFTVSATADSGLPVSFSSLTPTICTVSGNSVHVTGAVGTTCTIDASQSGNANYNAALDVTQSFKVLAYGVNKILPPLTIAKKDFQNGSTIPVKFTIFNGSTPVSWAKATLTVSDSKPNSGPAVSSGGSNVGNTFRYDPSGQLYIFNLSTKNTSIFKDFPGVITYTLTISLDDGETITQPINIK